jgi:hypothetical protein
LTFWQAFVNILTALPSIRYTFSITYKWHYECLTTSMVSSISDLARQHMLSILGYSSTGQTSTSNLSIGSSTGSTSTAQSPFAQMLAELQQMEQANPGQYAQVSQQLSANLAAASSTVQARGNTKLATALSTLSKDFSTAAQSGQLPNVTDLMNTMKMARQSGNDGSYPSGSSSSGSFTLGHLLSLGAI